MTSRLAFVPIALLVAACDSTAPVAVADLSISLASIDVGVGGSQQLEATVLDAEGNAVTGRTVTWTSSDAAVAAVSTSGLVSATALGVTQVTAAVGGIMDTVLVRVPAQQEAMDEQVAYWMERAFAYELYNRYVIQTPVGQKNISTGCPNGGSVVITGTTSQTSATNEVQLLFTTNACRVYTTMGELRITGPVSMTGSWSFVNASENLVFSVSVNSTISGTARLADGTPFSVQQTCLFTITRVTTATRDQSSLSGTLCGRSFAR